MAIFKEKSSGNINAKSKELSTTMDVAEAWIDLLSSEGYCVLQSIDVGSFGEVFTVQRHGHAKLLAVKKIISSRRVEEDPTILNEISLLMKLKHRHVISIKDVVCTPHVACIIMEYAGLGNLNCFVKERKMMSDNFIGNVFRQLLSALSFCHGNRIAHCDVNPSNMLMVSENLVKLADFGTAMLCIDKNGKSALCHNYLGQNSYLAPEVLCRQPFNPLYADVWSLGCVLYFMTFCDVPFTGGSAVILNEQRSKGVTFPQNTMRKVQHLAHTCGYITEVCKVNPRLRPTVKELTLSWSRINNHLTH
ncbi:NUAK family SNF1-like kinase 2 [Gigantopelta aegis]|uniref:NUAK family SNF1-like kinase 2 n=1 Tax=Gigantopelta aegis TaxID=1735272 RepID=UPI001B88B371|nr:NUAK family SNF1-like kinase 2 [Gigantopelta aegis]